MKNKYLKLIRIDNWIKNFLVFAPLFFGQQLFNVALLQKTSLAFFSFCLVASGMYIINDCFDIEEDKKHPVKKYRPLPSGEIKKKFALQISGCLIILGLILNAFLPIVNFYIIAGYICLNFLYNFKLKHIAIIDVCTVSVMYIIRLVVGSQATGIGLSMWIIMLTFFMAMFISLAKRRDDVINLGNGIKTRSSASGYNLEYLDVCIMLTSSIVVISYIMFATSPAEMVKMHSSNLYLTSIFVVLAILRYMQVILVEGKHGSPIKIFTQDRFVQLTVLGWIISTGIFFYL